MRVSEIFENRGEQAMAFAEYLSDIKFDKARTDFKKLGTALFKDGWTFYHDKNSPRFAKDEGDIPGNGWAISFPHLTDTPSIRAGIVDALWSGTKINHKQEWVLCHYSYRERAEGINEWWGLETFKQFLFRAAKPK